MEEGNGEGWKRKEAGEEGKRLRIKGDSRREGTGKGGMPLQ